MWPLSNAIAVIALRGQAAGSDRPKALSDGALKPSWGPFSPAGFMAMHWGDIFYFSVGALVWLFAWPDMTEAATLPTFSTLLTSWVMRVVLRNLLINVFIYEAWHQLLFGALATDSLKIYRCQFAVPEICTLFIVSMQVQLQRPVRGRAQSTAREVLFYVWLLLVLGV